MRFTEKAMKAAEEKFSRLQERRKEKKSSPDWHRQNRGKALM